MGDNDQGLDLRLCDQHPIKRIAMVRRKFPSHQSMVSRNRQLHESIGGNLLVNPFSARLKSAELRLNRNLPNGDGANMYQRS